MKKYISFFALRFNMGLQYRIAAAAGVITQFVWGFMECFVFRAFYETNPAAFPMEFEAVISYIWLQQAFLAFFAAWMTDNDVFDSILNGNIAYDLCRPVSIYNMWFAKNAATRISRALLRCMPILLVAFVLPQPYRMPQPKDIASFAVFTVTMFLGLGVTIAFCMLLYVISFFTVSPQGVRIFFTSAVEFFSGAIVPIPFLPQPLKTVVEMLPFAGMQNVPLRIYGGDIAGEELIRAVLLQAVWFVVLVLTGKALSARAEKKIVVQGG